MTPKKEDSCLDRHFNDYSQFHQTKGNEITHYFGIPILMVSILGLLSLLTIGNVQFSQWLRLDAGVILWVVAAVWYFTLNWKLALPFSLFAAGTYALGRMCSVEALWGLFVLGWVLQFVGHIIYEKKSPAFLKNVMHFLIGPFWVFARITRLLKD